MKEKMCRAVKTAAFCALLLAALWATTNLVERKASIAKFRPFLDAPGEYDVLFVGDSHSVNGVFPMELWSHYGVAAYNLAGIGNTLPVSYWVLMNALDSAQPRLVVIGVKDVEKSYKLSGSSSDVHTALDCFPLTRTKVRAVMDLMDDPYATDDDGNAYMDMRWEYLFTLGKYHSRWSEVSWGDVRYERNCMKGAEMRIGVAEPDDYDIIDEDSTLEESGWGFAYLRRMIEACRSRGIEVLLVHLPYPADEMSQRAANTVAGLAEEYDVRYVDFVSLDQVVDYATDCYDSFSHLNPSGAQKVTDYLGRYIRAHYDVPDRRQDPAYAHWAQDEAVYRARKLEYIGTQQNLRNVLMLLHDSSLSASIAVDPGSPYYADETCLALLQNIPREHIFEEDAYSKWSGDLLPLETLDSAAQAGEAYFLCVEKGRVVREAAGREAETERAACFGARKDGASVHVRVEDADPGHAAVLRQF